MKGNVMANGGREELTKQQERTINALLAHGSVAQAAKFVGVAEVTIWRWMQQDAFKRRYRAARVVAVERAIALAQQLGIAAMQTCAEIMADKKATPFARLAAVGHIKDMMLKGTELLDHESRIEDLEASLLEETKQPLRRAS
jgi:hypothetical protein